MNAPNDNTAPERFPRVVAESTATRPAAPHQPVGVPPPRLLRRRADRRRLRRNRPGIICLAYGAWGWAAFFLVIAALNFAGGSWYLSITRSRTARA